MSFPFRLVTPERTPVGISDTESVSLPTTEGEITVLANHAPLTALLVPGIVRISHGSGKLDELAVSGGFIHIRRGGEVTVLAETAERGEELHLEVIEEAKNRAKKILKEAVTTNDVEFAALASALERELARHRLATRHHTKRHNRL